VRYLLIRLVLNCLSIYVAARLVEGVSLAEPWTWWQLVLVGLVFGVLNAIVKPILAFFSIPALIVTLGLFYFIINALILWMTPLLAPVLVVEGFWAALKGSIIISIVNWAMSWLLSLGRAR